MEEVWKDIPNYEGLYQVSNLGRVRGLDRMTQCKNIPPFFIKGVELVLSKCAGGYFYCHLSKNNKKKSYSVHRLVATTFIPNPNHYRDVNHKNGDKSDNRVSNLEWLTHKENIWHAIKNGMITPQKNNSKRVICVETNEIFESATEAAKAKNCNSCSICHITKKRIMKTRSGKIYIPKTAGGYHWKRI